MKTLTFICLILLYSATLSAQHRYAVGGSSSLQATMPNERYMADRDSWIFTKGIGVSLLKFKDTRTFYQIGLHYRRRDIAIKNQVDYRFFTDSTGAVHIREVGMRNVDYHFNYISVPIIANYKVLKREGSNLFISGGIEPELLYKIRYRRVSTYDGVHTRTDDFYRNRFTTLVHAGIGWYQPVGNQWLLFVKPQFIYRVMKPDDEHSMDIGLNKVSNNQPYNLGLNVELHYTLR